MEIGDIAELCSSLSIKEGDGPITVLGEGRECPAGGTSTTSSCTAGLEFGLWLRATSPSSAVGAGLRRDVVPVAKPNLMRGAGGAPATLSRAMHASHASSAAPILDVEHASAAPILDVEHASAAPILDAEHASGSSLSKGPSEVSAGLEGFSEIGLHAQATVAGAVALRAAAVLGDKRDKGLHVSTVASRAVSVDSCATSMAGREMGLVMGEAAVRGAIGEGGSAAHVHAGGMVDMGIGRSGGAMATVTVARSAAHVHDRVGLLHNHEAAAHVLTRAALLLVHEMELLLVLLWHFWFRRNRAVHSAPLLSVEETVGWSELYLADYQAAVAGPILRCGLVVERWQVPSPGWVKINLDVTVDVRGCRLGFGVVFRDSAGKVLLSYTSLLLGLFSSDIGEVLVILLGLRLAIDLGLSTICVEFDAASVVKQLSSRDTYCSDIDFILDNILYLGGDFADLSFFVCSP
ncbi:hypothetical protein ACOSQ3_013376 [Xanthoceras sorbifolium]